MTHLSALKTLCILLCVLGSAITLHAQSTFQAIEHILTTKCTGTCHTVANPSGGLELDGVNRSVYTSLVNATPMNNSAIDRADKLVKPGYPLNSYLLRKVNNGTWEQHENYLLSVADGAAMPMGGQMLTNVEIELIRQWILFGCPDTGTVVDTQVLHNFYHVNGATRAVRPSPPPDSVGFQIKYGPFFLPPQAEKEYFIKHQLDNAQMLGVKRIDFILQSRMHHFNIGKHIGNSASLYPEGLRDQTGDTVEVIGADLQYIAATQFSQQIILPEGTAYWWDPNTTLDLNGHSWNIYPDSTLAIEAYINVYRTPILPETEEMLSVLTNYDGYDDSTDFRLPPFETVTFTDSIVVPDQENLFIDLFMLTAHTHERGESYKVWKRKPCGGKGELLYDGNYDATYSYNQGFWDYEHPTIRYFDDTVIGRVAMQHGIIQEATFYNTTNDTIYYGRTTEDEMMNIFMQFTVKELEESATPCIADTSSTVVPNDTTGITDSVYLSNEPMDINETVEMQLYPNPVQDVLYVASTSTLPNTELVIYNMLGMPVMREQTFAGKATINLKDLPNGNYILRAWNKVHRFTKQ